MSWKRLCAIGDLASDELRKFEVDGITVVAALVDGAAVAYPPLCPHMAEPLAISGVCEEGVLTCTKHLWQWHMKTGGEIGIAERPLLCYATKQEDAEVLIDIVSELVYRHE